MEEQQLILRWHYQESCLARNLRYLFESEVFTDVTLSVGFQSVKAHRIVLASCSPYFLQLFKSIESTQHPVIVLHNTSIEDLKAILSFVYRGQCIVTKAQLNTLLDVSKTLKIQGLCDMKFPEDETLRNDSACDYSTKENDIQQDEIKIEPEFNVLTDYTLKDNSIQNEVSNKNIPKVNNDIGDPIQKSPPPLHEYDYIPPALARIENSEKIKTLPIPKKLPKDVPETCKCFICGKYLSNQYNLRVHMETHDEAYHACQSCPHVSRSRDALRKHVSYRHPEEYSSRKRRKMENT